VVRRAREMVTEVLSVRSVPVRINAASSELASTDLEAGRHRPTSRSRCDRRQRASPYARAHLVVVSRATGLNPPIDNVDARLHDETDYAPNEFARFLDFSGKSALHPRQVPSLHGVFTPSAEELGGPRAMPDAVDAAVDEAVKLPNGEFADLPVADRARRLLMVTEGPLAGAPGVFSALQTETDAPCRRDGMVCRRGD